MKRFFNTLTIAMSAIGSIIGAGFVTGKEIVTFVYGNNIFVSIICIFLGVFLLAYFYLSNLSDCVATLLEYSNKIICILNILIMASMLGAAESLSAYIFGLTLKIPYTTLILIFTSLIICISGIEWIKNLSSVLVLFMLTALFISLIGYAKPNGIIGEGISFSVFAYFSMNMLLTQPFLFETKKQLKQNYNAFIASLLTASVLAITVFLYLRVFSEESRLYDIPVIYIFNSAFFKYLFILIIGIGIITTLVCAHYPLYNSLKQTKKPIFFNMALISLVFAISRLGFDKIVNKLYYAIAIIAVLYYIFIIFVLVLNALKEPQKHTCRLQERKV